MTIFTKYIDPFTDFGFKHLFGTEKNKKFLISFLNDLLDIEYPIVDVEYRNLEQLGLNIIDRKAIFDIYCTDEKKNNFIVELQRSQQKYFKDRSLYYTSFPIQEQSKKGDWDYRLKKIFFVGILEFEIEEEEDYLLKIQMMNTKTHKVFYDKLTYYYLQMPKFKKTNTELSNHLEYWLYYLNNLSSLQTVPEEFKKDEVIHEAFDVAEFLALSKDEQFSYQSDLKSRLDYKNTLDYAKEVAEAQGMERGIKKGMEKGMEKGMQKGMQKGREEGEAIGLKKGEKSIEIAYNLLKANVATEIIVLSTGLSIEEIEDLKKSIEQ